MNISLISQRDIVPSHVQYFAGNSTSCAKADFGARVLFEYRRCVECVVLHVFGCSSASGFGYGRHFRNAVLIGICGALCHPELLLETLLGDAR
jgi:hypothetical protein